MEKLQQICVEILSGIDELYEEALGKDITKEFHEYIKESVKYKRIIILSIRGYMRSSKSTAGFFISHIIRYYQKKYMNSELPDLTPEELIITSGDIIDTLKNGKFDQIFQADETVITTGVGSKIEEDSVKNILEVCARARNHIIFINPNSFAFPEICKYGLLFFDRNDIEKTATFMLYDMSNNYYKEMFVPLGMVTIPKLYDSEWKNKNKQKKEYVDDKEIIIGEYFDSKFEYEYETGIKLEIVKQQMSLESSKKRTQRLFNKVEEFKTDPEFQKAISNLKGMDVKRFIRGYVAYKLGGEFNSEEIQQLSDYLEGMRHSLYDK